MSIDALEVRQVARREIKSLCFAAGFSTEDYRVTVMQEAA